MSNPNQQLLLRALRLNAVFSGISSLVLLVAAPWIARQLGLPDALLVYVTGVILVLFALQLGNIVRTGVLRRWEITGIILADLAWVVGSLVLVAIYFDALTTVGLVLVNLVALAVLIFAIQQIRGLRRALH